MEADISFWRKTGHFYFALTHLREEILDNTLRERCG